jgi:DNA-binding transcriptional ArsR family regulator
MNQLRTFSFEHGMAQETRRRIAKAMADGRWRCVNDLVPVVKASASAIANNLGVMKGMGLLVEEQIEKKRIYRKAGGK